MTPNEVMLDVSKGHDEGYLIGAPNSFKMFSTIAILTRVNV
jgi:hypothetical protein